MFSCFDAIPACDKQTDGQTNILLQHKRRWKPSEKSWLTSAHRQVTRTWISDAECFCALDKHKRHYWLRCLSVSQSVSLSVCLSVVCLCSCSGPLRVVLTTDSVTCLFLHTVPGTMKSQQLKKDTQKRIGGPGLGEATYMGNTLQT